MANTYGCWDLRTQGNIAYSGIQPWLPESESSAYPPAVAEQHLVSCSQQHEGALFVCAERDHYAPSSRPKNTVNCTHENATGMAHRGPALLHRELALVILGILILAPDSLRVNARHAADLVGSRLSQGRLLVHGGRCVLQ